ncbi:hypothetical protein KSP40_PGU021702 [Platanthera guangdongensis]|uniref:Uncharacterized protein n=1 Tax=Platanthera guangdongensis TaxID=2320717 RepID=A0ABR2LZC1_9ASPA
MADLHSVAGEADLRFPAKMSEKRTCALLCRREILTGEAFRRELNLFYHLWRAEGGNILCKRAEAVWFRGRNFIPSVWTNTLGEKQIKQLRHAVDSKRRKVGEELYTTAKVEDALSRYQQACGKAKIQVLELLKELSSEMQTEINILVFSSMMLVIAKALFAHVRGTWSCWGNVNTSLVYGGAEGSKTATTVCPLHWKEASNADLGVFSDANNQGTDSFMLFARMR